jgi:hypothetical protein
MEEVKADESSACVPKAEEAAASFGERLQATRASHTML